MKITKISHFGIQRKIVANMTTESWETIPHVTYNYEPDVTDYMTEYKKLNFNRCGTDKITLNTVLLKVIVEGIKAAPIMNSHIEYNRKLVRGTLKTFEDINISMPMLMPDGKMMTVNLHNFERKNLDEMTDYIADIRRRMGKTDLNEAMYEVSLDNTLTAFKKGKIKQTVYRLIGSKTGAHKVKTLSRKAKKEYESISATEKLTKKDIEQGTVTVSNIGSLYRGQRGNLSLLEIIPPQVCAFGLGAVQEKSVVVTDGHGGKFIEVRQVLPICIAFDHRALDFGELIPFLKRLDNIFDYPQQIHSWKGTEKDKKHREFTVTAI
ncbi:MAG: 2-oxo acid dehydrogenase subunit E2 [Oscillospiraceae bacterium]|nr:2-oxo acid dehydrogenase subunit E2 [Oscillospiraceae bacterium]